MDERRGEKGPNHLIASGDREVIGLSRPQPDFKTPAHYLAIDLLNRADVDRLISAVRDV